MKKLILIIVLFTLFLIPASSQLKLYSFKVDTSLSQISELTQKNPLNSFQESDYNKLLNGFEGNKHLFPNQNKKEFYMPEEFGLNEASIDNMPIWAPHGNFAVKNFKPDSSIKYSLLIRKF